MSPARYRAAPPGVGASSLPPPPAHPAGPAHPVGEAELADWADLKAATALCRSDSALPLASKSPLRWAVASSASAVSMALTAWVTAGSTAPPPPPGGLDVGAAELGGDDVG